ncbi:hypothetical protein ACPPVO_21240 [Dactylosporangium sp. McL0621]|uniref:hypothetical protein n=1 Tax=Dactylosporangium sp. McL0621 TaxID=3415678 RepID=UPI003CEC233E
MNARGRSGDEPVNWVPIAGLTELGRALLGDRRGDRDVIPEHVRDRVTALAEQWAAHGFTAETVHAWKDLNPAAAAHLKAHGISPAALQRHTVVTPTGRLTLWQAVNSGALSAAEAVNELQAAGPPEPAARPSTPAPAAPRPAPALFSHPEAALDPDTGDRRERSTPHHTPFQT